MRRGCLPFIIVLFSFSSKLLGSEVLEANSAFQFFATLTSSSSCSCQFASKSYSWDYSSVPEEERVPLFQFKYSGFVHPQTTSQFRCLYECVDNLGNKEIVEYTHSETQPGHLTGGLKLAKLFHCQNSIAGFKDHGSYYEPILAKAFSPQTSSIPKLQEWSKRQNCKR